MNPNEAPKVAAIADTNGSTLAATASGITIGTTTTAKAMLLVVSEMMIASTTANAVIANELETPSALDAPFADGLRKARGRQHGAEDDPGAEQQDGAPVDLARVPPVIVVS